MADTVEHRFDDKMDRSLVRAAQRVDATPSPRKFYRRPIRVLRRARAGSGVPDRLRWVRSSTRGCRMGWNTKGPGWP